MTLLHPADADLLGFADGSADDTIRRHVASHLADCDRCRRAVQGYREVRSILHAMPAEAPEPLLGRIRASRDAGARAIFPTATDPVPTRRPRLARLLGRDAPSAAIVDGPPRPSEWAAWRGKPIAAAFLATAAVMLLALWPHRTPRGLRDTAADGLLPGLAFSRSASAEHPPARYRAATLDPTRLASRTLRYALGRSRATAFAFEVAVAPDPGRAGEWRVIQRTADHADTLPLALSAARYRGLGDFIVMLGLMPLHEGWQGSVVQRHRSDSVAWDLAVTGTHDLPGRAGPVPVRELTVSVEGRAVVRLLVRRDDGVLVWAGGPATAFADGLTLVSESPAP